MNRSKVIAVGLILMAVAFTGGRYSAEDNPSETTIDKTEESRTETERNKHRETTTVKIKRPDGTETSTTTIIEDSNTASKKEKESRTQVEQVVEAKGNKINVALLGAYQSEKLVYGLSVTKEVIGLVTAGIFGLNSGTIGLSIGVNF